MTTDADRSPDPRLFVCTDERSLRAVLTELASAGWDVHRSLQIAPSPWVHGRSTTVCTDDLRDPAEIGEVAELLTRGLSVAVLAESDAVATDLYDQCGRLARAEWYDGEHPPASAGLDAAQIGLLLAVRRGQGIPAAARDHHLSQRTAARRLADARAVLGCRTNGEAAARIGARIDSLRPGG